MNVTMAHRFRLLVCVFALGGAIASADSLPVQSVSHVDLKRYSGKWYEIAAFPMFFQRQCIGDTTAEYQARPDGDIAVVNRCRTETGFDEAYRYTGHALDIDQALRDNLIPMLPQRPVCREDCAGICPVCGVNRNVTPCSCLSEGKGKASPFDDLKKLL